jgi:uridine kinase
MPALVSFDAVVSRVREGVDPPLIGIDGLPVSGKSTLAERLVSELGLECIYLDDFVLPEAEWRGTAAPAFPFEYIRYEEFLHSVRELAATGTCRYRAYDWASGAVSTTEREVTLRLPVVIEGVSALNPDIADLYGLKIFVESNATSTLQASLDRGVGGWEREWRELFMPSVELYMKTDPRGRADLLAAGRGITAPSRTGA